MTHHFVKQTSCLLMHPTYRVCLGCSGDTAATPSCDERRKQVCMSSGSDRLEDVRDDEDRGRW